MQLVFGKFFVITVLVMHESLALHLQAVGVLSDSIPGHSDVVSSQRVKPPAQGKLVEHRSHHSRGMCVHTCGLGTGGASRLTPGCGKLSRSVGVY